MKQEIPELNARLIYDLLNVIHNAVLVTDTTQTIIFANSWASKMFMGKQHDLVGLRISDLFPAEDRDILVPNIMNIAAREQEFETEAMLQRLDGSCFPATVAATSFCWNGGGKVVALTVHDLTHLKTIEKTLKKSERIAFLGKLADDISHQIRNPITVIGGFARRLAEKEPCASTTRAILQETNRLEAVLHSLDNFIQLKCPTPQRLSIDELAASLESLFRQKIDPSGLKGEVRFAPEIGSQNIFLDPDLFLRAIDAILTNSCEACAPPKDDAAIILDISWSQENEFPFSFTITDYGIGIAKSSLPLVFNHFYSNKTNQTGMGLPLAQRIIEEQGGLIEIASEEGRFTAVTIRMMQERRRHIRTRLI